MDLNDIPLASGMSVVSNLAFENLDGTTITDISSMVELRENNANVRTVVQSISFDF